jgi:hypothetical protein
MSAAERLKGKRGEREFERLLERFDLDYVREQDGRTQGADFLIERAFALDVKRRNRQRIPVWLATTGAGLPAHLAPLTASRADGAPWIVAGYAVDLLPVLRAASR